MKIKLKKLPLPLSCAALVAGGYYINLLYNSKLEFNSFTDQNAFVWGMILFGLTALFGAIAMFARQQSKQWVGRQIAAFGMAAFLMGGFHLWQFYTEFNSHTLL
jgi:hypothetical protein